MPLVLAIKYQDMIDNTTDIIPRRQWEKYRVGSPIDTPSNEISGRYVEFKEEFFKPDQWRYQSKVNKQGSVKSVEDEKLSKKAFELQNQVWVLFKKYGNREIVPFVGAISGIQESVSPEWNNFRFIGSPFKTNRYIGVERSLKFNLKLKKMLFNNCVTKALDDIITITNKIIYLYLCIIFDKDIYKI